MFRSLGFACLAMAALVVSAGARAAEGTVVLGAVYNLSGPQAAFDRPSYRGAELAVLQANAKGGVLGKPVDLLLADPGSDLQAAAEQTRRLVEENPALSAVFGLSDSGMVLAAAPAAAGQGLAFVTSGATSPRLPGQVPEALFLACFGDNVQAAAAADYAFITLGARTASILYDSSKIYTTLLQGYFRTRFERLGGTIVSVESYPATGAPDGVPQGLAAADVVFLSAEQPEEAAAWIGRLRAAGFAVPILGGDGYASSEEWAKHPGVKDVYFTTHAYLGPDNPDPAVRKFVEDYRTANDGRSPDSFAALGYDTAGLLLAAIRKAGGADPAQVLTSLSRLTDYRGVTGTISYGEGRRIPQKSVTILEIRDGALRFVEEVRPENVPAP